jgi:CheY-like chemotaxis protein
MPSVLIVDDDPGVLELVSLKLGFIGIQTDTATGGRAALKRLCARTAEDRVYDVVILDIVMPDVDGWAVLKAIKYNPLWQSIKVIVISGHADSPSDLLRIIEFDGVYVEKRAGFADTVGEIVRRVIAEPF